jgi:hypothetical protein
MAQDYVKLYASLVARNPVLDSVDDEPTVVSSTPGFLN